MLLQEKQLLVQKMSGVEPLQQLLCVCTKYNRDCDTLFPFDTHFIRIGLINVVYGVKIKVLF